VHEVYIHKGGNTMALHLPKDLLTELRKRLANKPDTLSVMETAIARRIRECQRCDHLWVQRGRKYPTRCPGCGTTAWDLPLIDLIRQATGHALAPDKEEAQK